jgi:hypothetical protein
MQPRAHAHGRPSFSSTPRHRHRDGSGYTAMAGLARIRAARRRLALGGRRVRPSDEDGRSTKSPMKTWLTSLTSPFRWFGDPYLRQLVCLCAHGSRAAPKKSLPLASRARRSPPPQPALAGLLLALPREPPMPVGSATNRPGRGYCNAAWQWQRQTPRPGSLESGDLRLSASRPGSSPRPWPGAPARPPQPAPPPPPRGPFACHT